MGNATLQILQTRVSISPILFRPVVHRNVVPYSNVLKNIGVRLFGGEKRRFAAYRAEMVKQPRDSNVSRRQECRHLRRFCQSCGRRNAWYNGRAGFDMRTRDSRLPLVGLMSLVTHMMKYQVPPEQPKPGQPGQPGQVLA